MVTLKDIAKIAGVNVSTVSRALNDSDEVGRKTKRLVRKIADELNYTPNFSARALVGKATQSIGVILPEIKSNYYAQIIDYLEMELGTFGYTPLIGLTQFDCRSEAHYLQLLSSRNVDGILFVGTRFKRTSDVIKQIKQTYKTPVIILDGFHPFPEFDHICIDSTQGLSDAVRHLKEMGVTTAGFVSDRLACINRLKNLKKALLNYGIEIPRENIKIGKERFELGGYLRMRELLDAGKIPEVVFGAYDNMAIGVLKAIYERGLRIPEDVSIIGYDNIRQSEYLAKPLTTIYTPLKQLIVRGVELLIKRIKDNGSEGVVHESVPTELVLRETTKNAEPGT